MGAGPSPQEAVQAALERLGEQASVEEIAAYIAATFGIEIKPGIIRVVLASRLERPLLEQSRLQALEEIEKAQAEEARQPARKKRRRKPPADAGDDAR